MSKLSARLAVLAAAAFVSTGAMADATTLNVSATVNQVCRIYSAATGTTQIGAGGLSMVFGATGVDPTAATPYTQATTMYYRCNTTTAPSLTVGTATASPYNGTLSGPGGTMAYSVTWAAPAASAAGLGAVNAQSVTFNGTLPVASFQNMPSGAYTQAVAITLAP